MDDAVAWNLTEEECFGIGKFAKRNLKSVAAI